MRKLILASVLAAVPVLAFADAAEDAIEAREGYMKMLSINMGTLAGMAKVNCSPPGTMLRLSSEAVAGGNTLAPLAAWNTTKANSPPCASSRVNTGRS